MDADLASASRLVAGLLCPYNRAHGAGRQHSGRPNEDAGNQLDDRNHDACGDRRGVRGVSRIQENPGVRQQSPLRIVFEGSAGGLRKGGSVNFDGVQVGEIKSLKLDNPRKIVALVMLDNSAPIRKDTVVGLEFQGLTAWPRYR